MERQARNAPPLTPGTVPVNEKDDHGRAELAWSPRPHAPRDTEPGSSIAARRASAGHGDGRANRPGSCAPTPPMLAIPLSAGRTPGKSAAAPAHRRSDCLAQVGLTRNPLPAPAPRLPILDQALARGVRPGYSDALASHRGPDGPAGALSVVEHRRSAPGRIASFALNAARTVTGRLFGGSSSGPSRHRSIIPRGCLVELVGGPPWTTAIYSNQAIAW